MALSKTSLICTVFNEEENIQKLIDSILVQTVLPDEVIFVDGGSNDNTALIIKHNIQISPQLNIKFYIKKGNRSVGRNEAIKRSRNKIILSTDSGCILDKKWVENILEPFKDNYVEVVAGYYKGIAQNTFQKSLIPYVLVMEDRLDPKSFLPATRSFAFKKTIWKKVGGFDEDLSHNEDYAFANRLKDENVHIVFKQDAIVYWSPRNNLLESFKMFFRFAYGDIESNLLRDKVTYLFLRYILGIHLLILAFVMKSIYLNVTLFLIIASYIFWSISKNYKYVNEKKALVYLPILQILSDVAVISGSATALLKTISLKKIVAFIIYNKWLLTIILIYSFLMILLIDWGIPNLNHPFSYAMDEWHFAQSLRAFMEYGTALVSGSANIPLYHVISTILFLIPFYLFGIVDPFAIKNSVENLAIQTTFFEVLRLHTLLYGILTVFILYNIFKKFINFLPSVFTFFFVFTPIWLLLTNYYKYDITLVFWIMITLYFLFKYNKSQSFSYFILAGISSGLALATKFTAAPLVMSYLLSYFILSGTKKLSYFFISILAVLITFVLIGIPDVIFIRGNYYELIYSTLIQGSLSAFNFNIPFPAWIYLLLKEYPSIFGYFITISYYISMLFYGCFIFYKVAINKINGYKIELTLFITSFLFLFSTLSFNLDGGGNRALVLLPFMVLISGLFFKLIFHKFRTHKLLFFILLSIGIVIQLTQSLSWISVKLSPDPRHISSNWILNNIPKNSSIGIENIPIYQMLPDIVVKEFYFKQYTSNIYTAYNYTIIDRNINNLPKYIIITNDFDNLSYIKKSSKKDLLIKINREKYKKIANFGPNLKYYNLFADNLLFVITNIIQSPVTISIYEKK